MSFRATLFLAQVLFPLAALAEAGGECVVFDPQSAALSPAFAALAAQALPAPSTPPPTDAEVLRLVEALEPVLDKGGVVVGVKGLTADGLLDVPRPNVVIGDVSALLMEIHARDLATKVRADRTLPDQARRWTEAAISMMNGCVERRFAGRGGAPAHDRALAIVEKYRKPLETKLVVGKPGGLRPTIFDPSWVEPVRCPPAEPVKKK